MRLTITLFSFLAGFLLSSSITSSHYLHTNSDANPNDHVSVVGSPSVAKRQHRILRPVVDVCISITGTTFLRQGRIVNAALEVQNLQLCVCLSDLEIWLDTDVHAQLLVNVLGRSLVRDVLDVMLAAKVDSEQCVLPTHAQRVCRTGVPCAFACLDKYTEEDGRCVCLPPFQNCNGVCGPFTNGCGTAAPVLARHKRRNIPITTLVQAKHTCNIYESVCGIPGREDALDFECVDTRDTLDSCGGCVTPHPFYEAYRTTENGVECGRRPGVVTARCYESQCVVSRCKEGMQPSVDKTVCVPISPSFRQLVMDGFGPWRSRRR